MEDVHIYLERATDRFGDYGGYDPTAPMSQTNYYAYISNTSTDPPCEIELRLSTTGAGIADEDQREAIVITPRQLDQDGDLVFGVDTLNEAIAKLKIAHHLASRRGDEHAEAAQGAEPSD